MATDPEEACIESDASDSDNDLEEVPQFVKKSQDSSSMDLSFEHSFSSNASPEKMRRLDALLADHKEEQAKEERVKQLKEELLDNINHGREDDSADDVGEEDLASEHADHVDQMEVKSTELQHVPPGLPIFSEKRFCCLFTENVSPFTYGFTQGNTSIDRVLASTKSENVSIMLASKVLVACVEQVSCLDKIMLWLLFLLSVHSSPIVVHNCYENLMGIINQMKISARSKRPMMQRCWAPSVLDLLRLLVNLGASQSDLIVNQELFTNEVIGKHLKKDEISHEKNRGKMCSDSLGKVLTVIAASLQTKPKISKADLNLTFYMLAKIALDVTIQSTLVREFQVVFSSILECYSSNDWPAVVPDLCQQLCSVTDHHHNQAYLADLLPAGPRGRYLQVRLSYLCLYNLLKPGERELAESELQNFQLSDISSLGEDRDRGKLSPLCLRLQEVVRSDLYKLSSILKLLDFAVGDELHRSSQQKEDLEYLFSQVNLVLKMMRDSVTHEDMSKLKDAATRLTVKWSLTLQNQRLTTQKSIFHWLTASSHIPVTEQVLEDKKDDSDED